MLANVLKKRLCFREAKRYRITIIFHSKEPLFFCEGNISPTILKGGKVLIVLINYPTTHSDGLGFKPE